jgi:hypothetical protein
MLEPETLDELLAGRPSGAKSGPGVVIPRDGDCLFVHLEDTPYERVYVDAWLTVFESLEDARLVGFELKGLSHLRDSEGLRGLEVATNPDVIALLFAGFRLHSDGVEQTGTRAKVYSRAARAAAALSQATGE